MIPDIQRIETIRKNIGLTQKELAMRADVSQSVIAKIESGKINPSYSIVKRIFDVFESIDKGNTVVAKDIMSRNVISLSKSDTIETAISEMRIHGYSQLPVVSGNQAIGTISEKIILDIVSGEKDISDVLKEKVESYMSEALPRINEEESIDVISALLKTNSAVIVTKRGKINGIVTKADLFKMARKK